MPRDADRGVCAPEPECRRDWVPVEAPNRCREPKREDEPVRRAGGVESDLAVNDEQAGVDVTLGCSDVQSVLGGDVDA